MVTPPFGHYTYPKSTTAGILIYSHFQIDISIGGAFKKRHLGIFQDAF